MSNSATPINIMGNVDITIDGNCTLRSMMGNAISVKKIRIQTIHSLL